MFGKRKVSDKWAGGKEFIEVAGLREKGLKIQRCEEEDSRNRKILFPKT